MPYKEFANGNPLPASDIDTYLMDQSVMTFANSTARSAAIPSPKEGMLTYLEDTNAYEGWTGSAWVNINDNSGAIPLSTVTTAGDLIVANGNASVTRLGIGTNGQFLTSNGTTATWTTPSLGAEDWVLLNNGSLTTGAASTTLSGFAARNKYLVLLNNVSSTVANNEIRFRFNGTASNHAHAAIQLMSPSTYSSGSLTEYFNTNNGQILLGVMSSNIGSGVAAAIYITNAQSSTNNKYFSWNGTGNGTGGTGHNAFWGQGVFTNNSPISSFEIIVGGGTIDAGTFRIYGSSN